MLLVNTFLLCITRLYLIIVMKYSNNYAPWHAFTADIQCKSYSVIEQTIHSFNNAVPMTDIYFTRDYIYICSKLWSTVSYIFKENIFQTKGFKESLRKSKPIVERCVWMNLWINAFDILMWLFYLKTCSHRISIYNHACYRSHYTLMTLHSLSIIVAKLCNCVWI